MLDDLILAIEQRHARAKVRNHDITVFEIAEVARHLRAVDEVDVLAGERKSLNPGVPAIGDRQNGRSPAGVDDDPVRAIELARLFPLATECPLILTLAVVLQD